MEVRPLVKGEEARALKLLRSRPVSNVIVTSLLTEHRLGEGDAPSGVFYGCFSGGALTGVALVGRFFLMHGDERAARAFARVARRRHAAELGVVIAPAPLAACVEQELAARERDAVVEENLLLTLHSVATPEDLGTEVRAARPAEADEVGRIHALGSLALQGVDPSAADPQGYRERVRARVRRRRVWVSTDARGITFKADVAARAGRVAYIEGVMTRPDLIGAGIGTRAFSSLCRRLLRSHDTVCLLVAAGNRRALDFYLRVGFSVHERVSLVRYGRRPLAASAAGRCVAAV